LNDIKIFTQKFLEKEANALSCDTVPDLEKLKESVLIMFEDLSDEIRDDFSPPLRTTLKSEAFYKEAGNYTPAHLFKITAYKHDHYGNIWIAYVSDSYSFPQGETSPMSRAFIISRIEGQLKIIACMSVELDESYMEPTNWKASIYNPKEIDIFHLGEFLSTQRYLEPRDDGFSLKNYLEDEMCVNNPIEERFFEGALAIELQAEDIKTNRKVIENLRKKGMDVKVDWI